MRSVVLRGNSDTVNGIVRVTHPAVAVEHRDPPQLQATQVLLRPHSVGICGSDYHSCRTHPGGSVVEFSGPLSPPVVLGHEFCAEVLAVGSDVRGLAAGQWVVGESLTTCGECTACRSLNPNQCSEVELLGLTIDGTMADTAAVEASHCWPVDRILHELDDNRHRAQDVLTLVEPVACVTNALYAPGIRLVPGGRVLVLGQGPVGIAAAILAQQLTGCRPVVVERAEFRCALAEDIGSAHPVHADLHEGNVRDVLEEARRFVPGGQFDLIVEAAGVPGRCLPVLLDGLAGQGTLSYLARAGEDLAIPADLVVTKALRILGSRGPNGESMARAIGLVSSSYDRFRRVVTRRVGYAEVCHALTKSDYLAEGKVVFRPEIEGT